MAKQASRLRILAAVLAAIVMHCILLLMRRRPKQLQLFGFKAVPTAVYKPGQLAASVASSSVVPAAFLGCFRLAASGYIAGVGVLQLLRMKSHYGLPARAALLSFTVWTWWMLGLYFFFAGALPDHLHSWDSCQLHTGRMQLNAVLCHSA
jgi:hypothetical protein